MHSKGAVPYIHRHPKTPASPIREPSSARRPQRMNMMWWSPRLARRRRLASGATIIMTETTSPAYAGLAVAELIQSGHGADDAIERAPASMKAAGSGTATCAGRRSQAAAGRNADRISHGTWTHHQGTPRRLPAAPALV